MPSSRLVLSRRTLLGIGFALLVLFGSVRTSLGQTGAIRLIMPNQALGNVEGRYVAGKDTAVIVFLTEPVTVSADTQNLVISRDGAQVATLQPNPASAAASYLIFTCPSRAACGDWKAGAYTFQANVNGSTAQQQATFAERKGLRALLVPVRANYGPGDARVPADRWKTLGEFTRSVYPIAPDKLRLIEGQEVNASDDKFNTKTDAGRRELFIAVASLQPFACHEKPRPPELTQSAACYDKIIGFVKDRMGEQGNLQGFTMGFGTNLSVESDDDAPATVAHELAHGYVVGDEYQGGSFNCANNAPPPDYVGKDWDNRDNSAFSCTASKSAAFPGASGSAVISNVDFPYEVGGRGPLPNMISFMGSGAPQNLNWITPAIWKTIFDALDPSKAYFTSPKQAAPLRATAERWVYAVGTITRNDKIQLEPWYDYMEKADHKDNTGNPYTIQAVDAAGNVLARQAIAVDFNAVDAERLGDTSISMFEADVPFPDKTVAFQIVKGTSVLTTVKVSAHAPTVEVTAPKAGENVSGNSIVRWTGSDADGDKLYYNVEYSVDGENWETIADNLEKTELAVNIDDLPGSSKPTAQFRVIASDGVLSGEGVSAAFSVAPKAPYVEIEFPKPNATATTGQFVQLNGFADDLQDQEITGDDTLIWSSDLQGELGRGEMITVKNLKPGKHTITLKATNSLGLSGTGTTVLTVTEGAPPAQATTAPTVVSSRLAATATLTATTTVTATATTAATSAATVAATGTVTPTTAATSAATVAATGTVTPTTAATSAATVAATATLAPTTAATSAATKAATTAATAAPTPGQIPTTGASSSSSAWLLAVVAAGALLLLGGLRLARRR